MAVLSTRTQPPTVKTGILCRYIGDRETAALEWGNLVGVLFADNVVGTALTVGSEVAIGGDVAVRTLVSS